MSSENSGDDPPTMADIPDEAIADMADGIQRLLARREDLVGTLSTLHGRYLADESVQPAVNSLLDEIDEAAAVVNLVNAADHFGAEAVASECAERGDLPDADVASFLDLWEQISWIAPAPPAYMQDRQEGAHYWTSLQTGPAGLSDDGSVLFGERAMHGLDELWDVQAPFPEVAERNLRELQTMTSTMEQLPPSVEFDTEELQQLAERASALEETVAAFAEAVDELAQEAMPDSTGAEYEEFLE
ncbi:MAG: hypothetical protein ABEJ23_02015 [Haloarculaceae archaeon]